MTDCIFCKIVKGEIPSTKIFEDEHNIAIFDINPITKAHTLFISKEHYDTLLDVPAEKIPLLFVNLPRLVSAILKATGCEGFNIVQNNQRCAGQLIPHLHLHIVPRRPGDQIHFNWYTQPYQKDEMTKFAQIINQELSKK
ncbi:MAG: HIT family protein [Planctomycetota bacterium]